MAFPLFRHCERSEAISIRLGRFLSEIASSLVALRNDM